jgi:transcriptional regulator with XRE-family HTH domain
VNALGDFLRARREQVSPSDAGIRSGGLRRVPGLRREEVAMLAGVSSDYYLRLEQGRDHNPSVQVLEALAAVLRLDPPATTYLIGLAGHLPARRASTDEPVSASVRELIDGWPSNPAYVQNRFTDVLAANSLATALSSCYAPGANLLRAVFLDPKERELRRDWQELTEEGVASLRAHADPYDPRLAELVDDLSGRSDRFRQLWARYDVRPKQGRVSRLAHPRVGDLDLRSNKFVISGTDGLMLVVFHASPGSRDAERLSHLSSVATT